MLWSVALPLSDFQNWLSWCCTEIIEDAIGITLCRTTSVNWMEKVKVKPVERTITPGLQEQPVDHGRPVARPHDGHLCNSRQIHFAILDKYIWLFRKIYDHGRPIAGPHGGHLCNSKQIHLAILDKYVHQLETNISSNLRQILFAF